MSTGETKLDQLIKTMSPKVNPGAYVFCSVGPDNQLPSVPIVGQISEKEGTSIIISKKDADDLGLPYSITCAWITLEVHSSLSAVGLTAAFSGALAKDNISCNVVAGYYHDHIFVPYHDMERALKTLFDLSNKHQL